MLERYATAMAYFFILGKNASKSGGGGGSENSRNFYHAIRLRTSRIIGSLIWPAQGALLAKQKNGVARAPCTVTRTGIYIYDDWAYAFNPEGIAEDMMISTYIIVRAYPEGARRRLATSL